MPDAPRPVSLCASLLEHLRRPIPLRFQSGPFARRELRAVSLLGWILLAVGVLGTYAAVSEGVQTRRCSRHDPVHGGRGDYCRQRHVASIPRWEACARDGGNGSYGAMTA
jgi:hypothetical protein